LPYLVQGAALAPTTTGLFATGQFRRLVILFIAVALAVTLIAIEAPQATHASGRTDAQRVVAIARTHLGAHFRIGTTGMRYFDCSGLVYRVYQQAHLLNKIGGSRKKAAGYYHWFKRRGLVSRSNPQPGDIVWWTHHGRIVHTGLWIGNGRALSALTTGVKTHSLRGISTRFLAFGHVRLNR
jgi:cell wall-associated NlpC family hydrolase